MAPPSMLDVASVASIRGLTTVGGICLRTPPTAPVTPFFSCSSVATRTRLEAVSDKPFSIKKTIFISICINNLSKSEAYLKRMFAMHAGIALGIVKRHNYSLRSFFSYLSEHVVSICDSLSQFSWMGCVCGALSWWHVTWSRTHHVKRQLCQTL